MTKAELEELMDEYGIEDVQDVNAYIDFICDLLHGQKIELFYLCPYATKTIAELERAANAVFDLIEYIEGIMEDDNNEG